MLTVHTFFVYFFHDIYSVGSRVRSLSNEYESFAALYTNCLFIKPERTGLPTQKEILKKENE